MNEGRGKNSRGSSGGTPGVEPLRVMVKKEVQDTITPIEKELRKTVKDELAQSKKDLKSTIALGNVLSLLGLVGIVLTFLFWGLPSVIKTEARDQLKEADKEMIQPLKQQIATLEGVMRSFQAAALLREFESEKNPTKKEALRQRILMLGSQLLGSIDTNIGKIAPEFRQEYVNQALTSASAVSAISVTLKSPGKGWVELSSLDPLWGVKYQSMRAEGKPFPRISFRPGQSDRPAALGIVLPERQITEYKGFSEGWAEGGVFHLDGTYWRNFTVSDAVVKGYGGRYELENVRFLNCTFDLQNIPNIEMEWRKRFYEPVPLIRDQKLQ